MKNEQEIAVVKAFEGQSRLPENVSFSLDQHVAEERGVLTYQYLEELVNKFDEYFHHISRTTANTIALTKPEKGSTIQNMLIQNAACGAINDGEVTGEKSIDPLKQVNKAAAKTTNMNGAKPFKGDIAPRVSGGYATKHIEESKYEMQSSTIYYDSSVRKSHAPTVKEIMDNSKG
ncbi:unnamed protein product [Rotaria magnacalcarata]